jgi:hypothetical protein
MTRTFVLTTAFLIFAVASAPAAELPFNGFLEYSAGGRVVSDDSATDDLLLNEVRFQLDLLHDTDAASMEFRVDFVHDWVVDDSYIDIREASILVIPASSVDLKVGAQILTWGTGDFLFLNDLFPKDWQSFFIGRDDEYLKKPAGAVRATWYGETVNLDLVWMPVFVSDTFISGERLSYWDPGQGSIVGPIDGVLDPVDPAKTWSNSQWAGRLFGNFGGVEAAIYGYFGNYGTPDGFDPVIDKAFYPELGSLGASVRGAILGGIGNAEFSWYDSLDDPDGNDPLITNSEYRALVGFSHDLARNQTFGLQGYVEHKLDLPDTSSIDDDRWWITLRYTGLFLQQNLIVSWFSFYSPNEEDAYLRPKVTYKISDEVMTTLGGNIFLGNEPDTFFGQFENNTNVYANLKYSF